MTIELAISLAALTIALLGFRGILSTQYTLIETQKTLLKMSWPDARRKQLEADLKRLEWHVPFLRIMAFDWLRKVKP